MAQTAQCHRLGCSRCYFRCCRQRQSAFALPRSARRERCSSRSRRAPPIESSIPTPSKSGAAARSADRPEPARPRRRRLSPAAQASALGLSDSAIGGVTAASFASDALCFPSAGFLMDKCGRKWAGVPSLLGMSMGMFLLSRVDGSLSLLVAALLLGAGNGMSVHAH